MIEMYERESEKCYVSVFVGVREGTKKLDSYTDFGRRLAVSSTFYI